MKPFPTFLPAPSCELRVSVIMPARNESEGIENALKCLAQQVDGNGSPLSPQSYEILLLANNCSDDTATAARVWGQRHPDVALHVVETTFEGEQACIGHARKQLMNWAAERLLQVKSQKPQAICSTDADTRVSPQWIANTLREMERGFRAVGGRIFLDPAPLDKQRRTYLFDTAYHMLVTRLEALIDPCPCDPAPRHFQYFGASLAICPRLYRQIGGLPQVKHLEDMALSNLLSRHDVPIRHSPHVQVWTSARLSGRVEVGLSTQLMQWNGLDDETWKLPSGKEVAFKAKLRRDLRRLWEGNGGNLLQLADQLMMCPPELADRLRAAPYFGVVWEKLWNEAWELPDFREQFPQAPVEAAIWQLRKLLGELTIPK